ncbi:MFS transporter [Nocardia sp. NBC_01327]|uniref:MFS transporter n=1 Tax=Nocardia sp. NBC_01327 TaxID=2903593 RepID=UPI002E11D952|nr:MFS transporter [Nocardia sp. NBC_01327]
MTETTTNSPSPQSSDDPPGRRQRFRYGAALALIVLISELAPMEITLVYPAIPHMTANFRTPQLGWVLTMVSLVAVVSLPLVGKLADTFGKKRVMITLAVLFAAGSLISATAGSFPVLLIGRALQGTAGGMVAVSYALVRDTFPRRWVPVALGTVAAGIGVSTLASPFVAGWFIDNHGWQSVFWFMFGYVVLLIPVVAIVVPESSLRLRQRLDLVGVALLGAAVGLVLVGISQGSRWGWVSGTTLLTLIGGAGFLIAFIAWELRVPTPAIDLRLLAGSALRSTLLAYLFIGFMIAGNGLLLPQLLQTPAQAGITYGVGLTATAFALWTFPSGLLTMVFGPLGGVIARRRGARLTLIGAVCAMIIGLLAAAALPEHRWQIMLLSAVFGIGTGLYYASGPNLVMDAVPAEQSAVGAAMLGVVGQLGNAIAVTVLSAVMAQNITHRNPTTGRITYSDTAFQHSFLVAAVVGLAGLAVAIGMRHGRAPATGGAEPSDVGMRHPA